MTKKVNLGFLAMSIAVFVWGSSYIVREKMLIISGPGEIVFVQSAVAFLILFSYHFIKRKSIRTTRNIAFFIMLSGALGIGGFQLLVNYAMNYVGSTSAAVFAGLIPVFCYLLDGVVYGKKIRPIGILAIIGSLIGVVFMSPIGSLSVTFLGIGLLLMSDVCWILYCVIVKKYDSKLNFSVLLFYQLLGSILGMLPFIGMEKIAIGMQNFDFIISTLYLSLFNSILASALFIYAFRILGLTLTNLMDNIIPLVTLALNYFLLGTTMTVLQITGVLMTGMAVLIIHRLDSTYQIVELKEKEG